MISVFRCVHHLALLLLAAAGLAAAEVSPAVLELNNASFHAYPVASQT
jgi:hypothetical protein